MKALLVIVAAFLMASLSMTGQAWADVRKADVIAGATVEERDLSVAECPSVDADYAVLVDSDGTVVFSRESTHPSQIASITKVMTAIVAIDNAPNDLSIEVSEEAALIGESTAGLQEGDVMDFDTALQALLVPSGNDAAVAIADAVGNAMIAADPSLGADPAQVFVDAMNKKAAEIGCVDTLYENPHGLDDGDYAGDLHSTAEDQAKVAKCALEYDKIRSIVKGGSTAIQIRREGKKETIELETTDDFLEMYEYAIGVKTGSTLLAGPSFMGAAEKDGHIMYSVVLGSSDAYQRFVDTENLFKWGYEHIVDVTLVNTTSWTSMGRGGDARDVPVIAKAVHADWGDKTVPVTLADPTASVKVYDIEGNVSQLVEIDEVHGNVRTGDKLGTIYFKQHNEVIAQQDLVACEDLQAPNPIESLIMWFQGLVGARPQASLEPQVYNVMPVIDDNVVSAT